MSITLNSQGTIGTLELTGVSPIDLSGSATVDNLMGPSDVDPSSLFTNPSALSNVAAINDSPVPSFCDVHPSDSRCRIVNPPTTPTLPNDSPILNSLVTDTVSAESAQIKITSTNADILYYVLLPSAQPAPSVSQIEQGLNGADQEVEGGHAGVITVTDGVSSISVSPLLVNTSYTLYVVGESGTGGPSAVKQLTFATPDVTPSVSNLVYSVTKNKTIPLISRQP